MTNIDGEPQSSQSALGVDVVAAVVGVSDLDQSVKFFCEVFSCRVVVRHSDRDLLLAPKGFEIYRHRKDELHSWPHRLGLGVQFLMWAADSPDDLDRIAGRLRAHDSTVYTYVEDGMTIVEGTAPDGFRMIVAYPRPRECRARRLPGGFAADVVCTLRCGRLRPVASAKLLSHHCVTIKYIRVELSRTRVVFARVAVNFQPGPGCWSRMVADC